MVSALTRTLNGDARTQALAGDAEALPFADGAFQWVGMHMMLNHVPHIAEGWRVLQSVGFSRGNQCPQALSSSGTSATL